MYANEKCENREGDLKCPGSWGILSSVSRKGFPEKVAWRKGLTKVRCPAQQTSAGGSTAGQGHSRC